VVVEDTTTPPESTTSNSNAMPAVPQFALEKFMSQLERLNSQHEEELLFIERNHQSSIQTLETKLQEAIADAATANANAAKATTAQRTSSTGTSSSDVVAHDKCLVQVRQVEREFNVQLREKDKEIKELLRDKEGLEGDVQERKGVMVVLEKSLMEKNERLATIDEKEAKIQSLELSLSDSQADLESSQEAFTTLKTRVKTVATELKDRRIECRSLSISVQELTLMKSNLQTERDDFASKLSRQTKMNQAKISRIDSLEDEVSDLQTRLAVSEKTIVERGSTGDKALSTYKKRAQASLATANARAAAANLAREEAEIDTSNARREAENALESARTAEVEKESIVERCRKEVAELVSQNNGFERGFMDTKQELATAEVKYSKLKTEIEDAEKAKETLFEELNGKDEAFDEEREKRTSLEQEIAISRIKVKHFRMK